MQLDGRKENNKTENRAQSNEGSHLAHFSQALLNLSPLGLLHLSLSLAKILLSQFSNNPWTPYSNFPSTDPLTWAINPQLSLLFSELNSISPSITIVLHKVSLTIVNKCQNNFSLTMIMSSLWLRQVIKLLQASLLAIKIKRLDLVLDPYLSELIANMILMETLYFTLIIWANFAPCLF